MLAKLQPGQTFEGFTPDKDYEYFNRYDIQSGELTYYIKADDNGKKRTLSLRDFERHFYGRYKTNNF